MIDTERARVDLEHAENRLASAEKDAEKARLIYEHTLECEQRGDAELYTVWPGPGWEDVVGRGLVWAGAARGEQDALRRALSATAKELRCSPEELLMKRHMLAVVTPYRGVWWEEHDE